MSYTKVNKEPGAILKSSEWNDISAAVEGLSSGGGGATRGSIRVGAWSHHWTRENWHQIYSGNIKVNSPSVVLISINGHWRTNHPSKWVYLAGMVNDKMINPEGDWGCTHTYFSTWHPIGYSASAEVPAGRVKLGIGVRCCGGGQTWINGSSIDYVLIPK